MSLLQYIFDYLVCNEILSIGDGLMGFCPLIRMGLNYFLKVDLRNKIMIVSNDHNLARRTKGIKVGFKKCDACPTFRVRIGKKHYIKLPLDTGSPNLCTIPANVLEKWGKVFKDKKVFDGIAEQFAIHDTTVCNIRALAYRCEFAIKSLNVKDALVIDDPFGYESVGEEIFHYAVISFDPWHRKIIFQPYE
ncbi:MAG: hypothetical protein VZR53_19590 [Prevotella sp.]|nr:hypothetical protein [Prevotella sp.]